MTPSDTPETAPMPPAGPAPAYAGLKAVLFNASLERRAADSHTGLLLDSIEGIMTRNGVAVDRVHVAEEGLAPGVGFDMTDAGWESDGFPALWERVKDAHIFVVGTPIWIGEESSLCRRLIERLVSLSDARNDKGQSVFYGKVGGAAITGNEDGIKHVAMSITYALAHPGLTVPPQPDCGWIGDAGPGPSYGDELEDGARAGFANDFTRQSATTMAWNLMHMAGLLERAGGLPRQGNDRNAWEAGERFGFETTERRV